MNYQIGELNFELGIFNIKISVRKGRFLRKSIVREAYLKKGKVHAVKAAKDLYGYNLAKAVQFVDILVEKENLKEKREFGNPQF